MNVQLTAAELSNLITACATSLMRHDSPEWQAGLDAIADKLYAARADLDHDREAKIRHMVSIGYERHAAEYSLNADWQANPNA